MSPLVSPLRLLGLAGLDLGLLGLAASRVFCCLLSCLVLSCLARVFLFAAGGVIQGRTGLCFLCVLFLSSALFCLLFPSYGVVLFLGFVFALPPPGSFKHRKPLLCDHALLLFFFFLRPEVTAVTTMAGNIEYILRSTSSCSRLLFVFVFR